MTKTTVEKIHEELWAISDVTSQLRGIAGSLHRCGLDKLSAEIFEVAAELDISHKTISSGIGEMISDRLKQSQEATRNMVVATLSGIKLAKVEKTQ